MTDDDPMSNVILQQQHISFFFNIKIKISNVKPIPGDTVPLYMWKCSVNSTRSVSLTCLSYNSVLKCHIKFF